MARKLQPGRRKGKKYPVDPKKHRNARKTQCPNGHVYDAFNTWIYTDSKGYTRRYCKICRVENVKRLRAQKKSASV